MAINLVATNLEGCQSQRLPTGVSVARVKIRRVSRQQQPCQATTAALLDTYAIEQGMADRQVLEISDEQHQGIAAPVALDAQLSAWLRPAKRHQAESPMELRSIMAASSILLFTPNLVRMDLL